VPTQTHGGSGRGLWAATAAARLYACQHVRQPAGDVARPELLANDTPSHLRPRSAPGAGGVERLVGVRVSPGHPYLALLLQRRGGAILC